MSSSAFALTAAPGTDIWRKPPTTDILNAPTHFATPPQPLSTLRSARVTFSAPYTHLYDQAGLLILLTPPSSSASKKPKWVKTGIEMFEGIPRLSTVACDRWADWSLAELSGAAGSEEKPKVTVLVEKHSGEGGPGASLMVYTVGADGEKVPLREVCWVFAPGDEEGGEGWTVQVGAYLARPGKNIEGQLKAEFEDLAVEWSE